MKRLLFIAIAAMLLLAGCATRTTEKQAQQDSDITDTPDAAATEPAVTDVQAPDADPAGEGAAPIEAEDIPADMPAENITGDTLNESAEEGSVPDATEPDKEDYEITLTADYVNSSVLLTWTKYEGAVKNYKVIWSNTNANPAYYKDDVLDTVALSNTYADRNPSPGINYYRVVAIGELNRQINSNIETVEIPDPTDNPDQEFTVTAEKTGNGVLISWTKYSGQLMYYKIVRSSKNPVPRFPVDKVIYTVPYQNVTSYTDMNPDAGDNYYAVAVVRKDRSRFNSEPAMVTV